MPTNFLGDERGNFAVILGIALPVLVLSAGTAIDYSYHKNSAYKMQELLDAATMAGATTPGKKHEKIRAAKQFFKAQIKFENKDIRNSKPVFKFVGKDRLEGFAKANTPMFLTGSWVKGPLQSGVSNAVRISEEIQSIRFKPIRASGWWEKKVRLMVTRPGSGRPEEIINVHYNVNSGTRPPTWSEMTVSKRGWVDLGDFDHAYLEFTIGPKKTDFHKICPGCPTVLRSDDPSTSDRFVIDGRPIPRGTRLDIFDFTSCSASSRHSWEDGGGLTPDIYYEVETQCSLSTDPNLIRFLK